MKKKNEVPLFPDTYYHIYNRGINGTNLFIEESNYYYFLEKYSYYINRIADTYAYCLLKNHFHFLIKIKTEEEINIISPDRVQNPVWADNINKYISLQFSHLFNGYSQSINKRYKRTGGLFETPFRRIPVMDDSYFTQLICYIHTNPQKHGFVKDFRDYPYSSYHSHLSNKETKLKRKEVIDWFGGEEGYKKIHQQIFKEAKFEKIVVDFYNF